MRHETSKALFAYWNGVRAERLAPRRFEIEPARIASILPSTFILERLDSRTFRFRLAGTWVCDYFGRELRGSNFIDGWSPEDRRTLEQNFSVLTTQAAALLLEMEAAPSGRASSPFEVLMLPLQHTGDSIDRVLGSFSALARPDWLGHATLSTKRVISRELILPNGGCMNAVAASGNQAPLLMHAPNARIVRSERRQFRVFEGGLSQTDTKDS